MDKTIFFVLVCYGITNIIIYGSIFDKMRKFFDRVSPDFIGALFGCMMCMSFWVGFSVSFVHSPTLSIIGFDESNIYIYLVSIFLDSCFASGTVWLVHNFEEMLERVYRQ